MPPSFGVEMKMLIVNVRLTMFYWILLTITFSVLVTRFIVLRQFESLLDVTDGMSFKMSTPLLTMEEEEELKVNAQTYPFCANAEMFKYVWSQQWTFHPTGCIHACEILGATSVDMDCEPASSLTSRSRTEIFVTTLQKKHVRDNLNGSLAQKTKFSPLVDQVQLRFAFEYKVSITSAIGTDARIHARQQKGLLTIVAQRAGDDDDDHQVYQAFEPGEVVQLPLVTVLVLAGLPDDYLNQPQNLFQKNADKEEGALAYPIGRTVGAVIRATVICSNTQYDFNSMDMQGMFDSSKHDAVCVLSFRSTKGLWGWRQKTESIGSQGQFIYTYESGIEIKVDEKAVYRSLDSSRLLVSLSSMIVLLSIPKTIIVMFMTMCLGRLSMIYRRAIWKPFQVEQEMTAMATRAMSHTHSLHLLGGGDQVSVVEGELIKRHLREILKGSEDSLSPTEAEALIRFVYKSIGGCMRSSQSPLSRIVTREIFRTPSPARKQADAVSIDQLGAIATRGDSVEFHTLVEFFDIDRRHGFFERLFMPAGLTTALRDSRRMSKSDPAKNDEDVPAGVFPSCSPNVVDAFGAPIGAEAEVNSSPPSPTEEICRQLRGGQGGEAPGSLAEKVDQLEGELRQMALRLATQQEIVEAIDRKQNILNTATEAPTHALLRRSDAAIESVCLLERRVAALEAAQAAAAPKGGSHGARTSGDSAAGPRPAQAIEGHVAAAAPPPPGDDEPLASRKDPAAEMKWEGAAVTSAATADAAGAGQLKGAAGAPRQLRRIIDMDRDRELVLLRRAVEQLDGQMQELLRSPLARTVALRDEPVEPKAPLYNPLAESCEEPVVGRLMLPPRPLAVGGGTPSMLSAGLRPATTSWLGDAPQAQEEHERPLSSIRVQ